jgi:iron complex transport system substrate-binding protein
VRRWLAVLALALLAFPATAAERVVALGGAVTETIYALGLSSRIVGADTTSLYPPETARLPKVGYLRSLSAEGILSLTPDLVLAAADAGPASVIAQLRAAGVRLVVLAEGRTPESVVDNIVHVGTALGVEAAAERLAASVREDFARLHAAAGPSALFLLGVGRGAPMAAGGDTAADAMLGLAGARNVFHDAYRGYKPVSPEAALAAAPAVVVTTTQTVEEAGGREKLLARPEIALTPAGQAGRLVAMDALYLLGFGPRSGRAARELAEALHAP